MPAMADTLVLHAPNVHMGGGLVLLKALVGAGEMAPRWAQVDARTADQLNLPASTRVEAVRPSLLARLGAEVRLWRQVAVGDRVLCFHGLPPLLPSRAAVIVFLQNRILVDRQRLTGYPLGLRARLEVERLWFRWRFPSRARLVVQSDSMARAARNLLGETTQIAVLPFARLVPPAGLAAAPRQDFVYVASDEPHKNHRNLLEAWRLLGEAGLYPSLALTVDSNSPLAGLIADFAGRHGLKIENLGGLSSSQVQDLYRTSKALVYASVRESLGLPLLEARNQGLPILAPELDYVRDIVEPAETFDPRSPVSIARAVRRFIGQPEQPRAILDPAQWLREVLA
jgi:glycosyltransferase involved in cell wall biosynthesis